MTIQTHTPTLAAPTRPRRTPVLTRAARAVLREVVALEMGDSEISYRYLPGDVCHDIDTNLPALLRDPKESGESEAFRALPDGVLRALIVAQLKALNPELARCYRNAVKGRVLTGLAA